MNQQASNMGIQNGLTFMFRDAQWQRKLLVMTGLIFANFLVPVIPMLFVTGYMYRIMERVIREDGEPVLPEWSDWTRLLVNGLRYFGVFFLYALPAILLFVLGYGVMMVMPFVGAAISSPRDSEGFFIIFQLVGMLAGFALFALAMLLTLVVSLFSPVALCHMVAKDQFSAAFRPGEWWSILKANPGGYFLAWVLVFGTSFLVTFVYQILYLTIIFCCLIPFFISISSAYLSCVTSSLFAEAYRKGAEKLENLPTAPEQPLDGQTSATSEEENQKQDGQNQPEP